VPLQSMTKFAERLFATHDDSAVDNSRSRTNH